MPTWYYTFVYTNILPDQDATYFSLVYDLPGLQTSVKKKKHSLPQNLFGVADMEVTERNGLSFFPAQNMPAIKLQGIINQLKRSISAARGNAQQVRYKQKSVLTLPTDAEEPTGARTSRNNPQRIVGTSYNFSSESSQRAHDTRLCCNTNSSCSS